MISIPAIVGVDLSLTSTGIAVIDHNRSMSVSRIRTTGHTNDTWAQRHERLGVIVGRIVGSVPVGALVMLEGPAYSQHKGSAHDRAGLWWLTYDALRLTSPVVVCPIQTRIRYACGKGAADKDIVLSHALRRYGTQVTDLEGNDEADALIMAALGARWIGYPVETVVPLACSKALDALGPRPDYRLAATRRKAV